MVLSGREDRATLEEGWQIYLEIKEKNFRPEHTNPTELDKIRQTVEILKKGGLSKRNYIVDATCYGLRVDLGMFGTRSLIGDMEEEDKSKAVAFAKKMSEILIKHE
jgi:hypothetical protein